MWMLQSSCNNVAVTKREMYIFIDTTSHRDMKYAQWLFFMVMEYGK